MKLTRYFLLLLIAVIALNFHGLAQSINSQNLKDVKVEELTDEEVRSYYQRAINAGLSEEQAYKMAEQRGMPAQEIEKLRKRVDSLKAGPRQAPSGNVNEPKNTVEDEQGEGRMVNQDAMKVPMKKMLRDTTIFGSELFTEASTVFEPNLRIPTPAGYILAPDDEITINVYGYSEQVYNLTVTAEGDIYIPNVGPIKVNGLSIEAASDRIRNKLASTIYKAIRSGQTKVEVTLSKIRSIRVTVIGQATKPGTYTVSSLTTLFNLLSLCGGPSDMGSFRNIELIRGNKVLVTVDLYDFLTNGNRTENLLLQEQDVIRIPFYSIRVETKGAIKRPGKFEMKADEDFADLLEYTGGFTDSAYRSSVQVTRLSDTGIVLFDIANNDFNAFNPKTGDSYLVSKNINRFRNRVTIKGAVLRPGDFELKGGMNLKELLEAAGGLREDAFVERGIILRQNEDLTLSTKSFVVADVLSGRTSVPLIKEDIVEISSILDLQDARTINIDGSVREPGTYAYSDGLTVKDLILQAGGFSENANPRSVEISRRIKNPDTRQADFRQTEIISVDLSQGLASGSGETLLMPFDIINVRSEAGYNRPRVVYVEGQVMNTGRYVLEASGERISHLLQRAGGFKGAADSSSVTIRRIVNSSLTPDERQSIVERMLDIDRDSLQSNSKLRDDFLKDVELMGVNVKKIKDDPGGNEDLILEDGDMITVARASNLVRVNGEVYNPTLLPYENNTSAKFYIKRAGDFTNNARKSGVFVIYPDGRASSVKRFLFFKSYPSITPRTEVFVPAKEKDNRKGFGPTEWIAFSTIIATLGTLIVTIIKN